MRILSATSLACRRTRPGHGLLSRRHGLQNRLLATVSIRRFSMPWVVAHAQVLLSGPFAGVNLSALSADQRRVVVEASEDFQAVLAGMSPPHATHDLFKAGRAAAPGSERTVRLKLRRIEMRRRPNMPVGTVP